MKSIVIINQPIKNRGDESAHRSLIRSLNKLLPNTKIIIHFIYADSYTVNEMIVDHSNNEYIITKPFKYGQYKFKKWGIRLNILGITAYHPEHRPIVKLIKSADIVLNAPGGICMGLFQNWPHIYYLLLALKYKKPVAYYSRSFGPFPDRTVWDRVFKERSLYILKNVDFLSIRDSKSMELAEKFGISYIPSIDTAFLDNPEVVISTDLYSLIGDDYVVFVPNSLTWHPAFKNSDSSLIDEVYIAIVNILLSRFSSAKIIMLPQLFNNSKYGDEKYFQKIRNLSGNNRVVVLPETISSDIQQKIIEFSRFVVGARYHSIVFAINNSVPFVALSYEHKIAGLLRILKLEKYMIKFNSTIPDKIEVLSKLEEIIESFKDGNVKHEVHLARLKAREIATFCVNRFVEFSMKMN